MIAVAKHRRHSNQTRPSRRLGQARSIFLTKRMMKSTPKLAINGPCTTELECRYPEEGVHCVCFYGNEALGSVAPEGVER